MNGPDADKYTMKAVVFRLRINDEADKVKTPVKRDISKRQASPPQRYESVYVLGSPAEAEDLIRYQETDKVFFQRALGLIFGSAPSMDKPIPLQAKPETSKGVAALEAKRAHEAAKRASQNA